MNKLLIVGTALCVMTLASCSDRKNVSPLPSISPEAKRNLARPINCETAKQDIATLESERASVAKQIASGVRSIVPVAAVAGLLTADYSDRVEVASGQYNAEIETKIEQIKRKCGVR